MSPLLGWLVLTSLVVTIGRYLSVLVLLLTILILLLLLIAVVAVMLVCHNGRYPKVAQSRSHQSVYASGSETRLLSRRQLWRI